MKKILVYGDSNVWGDGYKRGITRLADELQWTNILQNKLGNEYKIIQEGLPGRIAGNEDSEDLFKNGKDTFIAIFRTAAPIDKLIISLGTNDLQDQYNKAAQDIIKDLMWYKEQINRYYSIERYKHRFLNDILPEIIFILPSNIKATDVFTNTENKRQEIISYFKNNNEKYIVLNDLELVEDGIHFSINDHQKMADTLYRYLKDNN